jgi:hypothetical protein
MFRPSHFQGNSAPACNDNGDFGLLRRTAPLRSIVAAATHVSGAISVSYVGDRVMIIRADRRAARAA